MFSILYVDDEPGLLEVGKLFLEQSGQFSVETITSAPQALEILRSGHFDAIISDYQMPVMDGIEFLKRVRTSGNTIPFIIFTGRGREEIVIQALNEGADFYLQKGGEPVSQFTELAHKIRQAVQQRMAEASIRDHERREADIINFLPDATFAIDTRGVVIAWNRAMEMMTGVKTSEILGKGDYAYAIPFYHERRPILIDLVLSDNPDTVARYPYIKRDGKTLFSETRIPHLNNGRGAAIWFTASPLYDTGGNVVGAIESIREITDWKRAEEALNESERRFRELSDLLPQVVYEIDMDGNLKYANHIAFEIFGYSEDEFRQGLNVMQMIAPDDRERAATGIRAICDGKGRTGRDTEEYQALRKDGSTFPVSIYSSPVVVNNRITGLRGIIVDITERKRAEDEIRDSAAFLNSLIDQSPTPMWISDDWGTLIRINRACCELLNVTDADVVGKYSILDDNIVKEQGFLPQVRDVFNRGVVAQFPLTYDTTRLNNLELKKFASVILDVTVFPVRDSRGKITNAVIQYANITKRRQAESALKENEQKYRTVFETTGTATVLIENNGTISLANSEFERLSGYPKDEIENRKKWTEFVVQEDLDRMLAQHQLRRQDQQSALTHYEFRFMKRSGEVRDIYLTIDMIPGTTKSVASLLDITERKGAEGGLITANQEYTNLLDQIQDVYYRSDTEGRLIKASRSWATLLGYEDISECLGRSIADDFYINPADRKPFLEEVYRNGKVTNYEVLLKKKDGTPVLVATSSHLYHDPAGNILGIEGTFRDITERKRAEDALRESEQRYRNVVEDQTEFICRFLPDGTHVFVNHAYCRYFGLPRDEILGHRFRPNIPAEDKELLERFFTSLTPDHPVDIIEHRIIMPDGGTRWQRWSDRAIFDPSGRVTEYQSVGRDITEHKRAEEALRESEAKYRILADTSPEMIYLIDPEGRIQYVNTSSARAFRTTPEDLVGKKISDLFPPDIALHHLEGIRKVISTRQPVIHEIADVLPSGKIWIDVRLSPVIDHENRVIGVLGLSNDITQRKTAEEALRESEDRYRKLVEITPDPILVHQDGRIVYINPAGLELLGAAHTDQVVGKPVLDFIHTGSREMVRSNIEKDLKSEKTPPAELRMLRLDGETVTVEGQGVQALYQGKPAIQVAIRDITERKQAEDALRESELLLREIFDNANDAIFLLERYPAGPGKYLLVNDKAVRMLGYSQEEILTMSPRDIVPEDIAGKVMPAVIQKLLRDGHATFESAHRRKDGSIYPIEVSTHTFRYQGKDVDLSIIRDITERKRSVQIIQETNKKISLLSSITRHDVANQVSLLKGYATIALMKKPDPVVADFLAKIDTAGSTIARQIEFTREYQELGMHAPGWHRIREIVAQQKTEGISFSCTCDAEIYTDSMIAKVFFNLFDNATRHGERVTAITVGCERAPDGGMFVVVEDNGVGIPGDEKEKIFEKGYGKNTGYGLFLAREILAITGITISETGIPGAGARFEIIVPKDGYRFTS